VLQRDYSHPSIVGWCALNETSKPIEDRIQGLDDLTLGMFLAAKAQDATRPVLDASGYSHRVPETDVYDSHDYSGNPTAFQEQQAGLQKDKPYVNAGQDWRGQPIAWSVPYRGQPYFVSEFGGTWWNLPAKTKAKPTDSWGYGEKPKTLEEFHARFENLCRVLLDNPHMFGYCYTQLTDVFQEQNGIYLFNRNAKFDTKRIRAAQQRPAAIEKNKRG